MKQYKTGKKYSEFFHKSEACAMNFRNECAEIFMLLKSPKSEVVSEIVNSEPFFQIYTKNNIIFLLVKFGNLDWIDIPYIHKGDIITKIDNDNFGYSCRIYFADANTGCLLAKRYSCFSNGLSKAFYFAIQEQQKHLPKNILEKINSIRASFHPNEIARLSLGR